MPHNRLKILNYNPYFLKAFRKDFNFNNFLSDELHGEFIIWSQEKFGSSMP